MNQFKEFSFKNLNQTFMDEECNALVDDLSEGWLMNDLSRESSLQQNMEYNSFSKYDKSYWLCNFKNKNNQCAEVESTPHTQISSWKYKIKSEADEIRNWEKISLKEEVSLLLRKLVSLKKNSKDLKASDDIWSNNELSNEVLVTMREIEPVSIINWF